MKIANNLLIHSLILLTLSLSIADAESGLGNRQIFVGASPRALGMGGAFTAGPSSSDSFLWNPSSLGFLSGAELSIVGLPFGEASADREGAFSLALNPQQLGIATRNVGNVSVSSWFDGFKSDGEKNRMMLLGYGLSLGKTFAAGASIRHHRWSQSTATQLGWSFDLGLLYTRKLERLGDGLSFGLTFEDLGGHIWEAGELVEKMAPVTRLGTTYYIDPDTIVSGDFVLRNDAQIDLENRFRAHIGAERWLFNQRFGVRVGYTSIANYDRFTEGEWSRGFSLRNSSGQLDYAYVSGDELEQGVHFVSATLRWGGAAQQTLAAAPPEPTLAPPPVEQTAAEAAPGPPAPILMPTITPVELAVSEAVISPNGDGVKDAAVFDFSLAGAGAWRVEIRDAYSEIVRTFSGTGSPAPPVQWDGRNTDGTLVSDGKYTATLALLGLEGERQSQRRVEIAVDTMPVELEISAEPPVLASDNAMQPGSDAVVKIPTVHVLASDPNAVANWELLFFNSAGEQIDRIHGARAVPSAIPWSSWRRHQSVADYRCALTVYDLAGNRSTAETEFSGVDLRPGGGTDPATAERRQDERGAVFTLSGVAFASNTDKIKDESALALEKAAQAIAAHPEAKIIVEGHTDDRGEADYNLALSRKRAKSVMAYLIDRFGVAPSRLSAAGFGEARPIAPNTNEANRKKNRRVEIVLLTGEGKQRSTQAATGPVHAAGGDATALPSYTVLVSSFKNRRNAEMFVEALAALDLGEEVRLAPVSIRSEPWYRVLVGRFPKREDATPLARRIKTAQGIDPLVISDGKVDHP